MNPDDQLYAGLLFLAIPLGYVFGKFIRWPQIRALFSFISGFIIVLAVCKYDTYHSLILIVSNSILILSIHASLAPYFSFLWCFSYLLFFRTTHLFGLPTPVPYANAVQLVLTLKSVGLAFEVQDSHTRRKKLQELEKSTRSSGDGESKAQLEKLRLENEYLSIDASFLDILFYSYCHFGILTGPYFRFRTYYDWLHNSGYVNEIDSLYFLVRRGMPLPLMIALFLFLSKYISFQDALKDEFYEYSLVYKLVYMSLIFFLFRNRFYIAWILAEFSAITSGFGAYPACSKPKPGAGPTDLKELDSYYKSVKERKADSRSTFNFETVHNIDEYGCEAALTVKQVLHHWNMSVQYWMANFVYKRVPFKQIGQPITMAVSAYWHGLHPGYYLSMLTTSPGILAEGLMEKGFKQRFLAPSQHKYYNFCTWFFRTRLFDYMSMGFILLSYDATIRFWRSVYFIGHASCVFFIIIGYVLVKTRPRDSKKDKKN